MLDSKNKGMTKRVIGTVLVVAAIGAAAVVVNGLRARSSDATQLKSEADKQSVRTVTVITPTESTASPNLELPGRIEA